MKSLSSGGRGRIVSPMVGVDDPRDMHPHFWSTTELVSKDRTTALDQ
jgi:hypothetical protein